LRRRALRALHAGDRFMIGMSRPDPETARWSALPGRIAGCLVGLCPITMFKRLLVKQIDAR
jgi:hypothetical protein